MAGGRKTKCDAERTERICEVLRQGNTRRVAAALGGIDEKTFYNWLDQGQQQGKGEFFQFFQSVMLAEAEAEANAVATIQKAANGYETTKTRVTVSPNGESTVTETSEEFDWKAAESWLKRRRREEWGDNVKHDLDQEISRLLAELAGGSQNQAEGSA